MEKHGTRMRKASLLAFSMLSMMGADLATAFAQDGPAKQVFGNITLPSAGPPTSYGSYAKGCQSGAVALPTEGPGFQAMRLSRNRRWGQPQLVSFIERFAQDAQKIGWPGLLIGDISQPRGGPMLTGHASHQIGLDVDIWWRQMPDHVMGAQERESTPFISMLDKSRFLTVDDRKWSPLNAKLVMLAASYPQVERIFVNPAIKQKLCQSWTGDRTYMGKIRPIYGHDEHFHVRLECPPGATHCKPQAQVGTGDGCDKSLAWWFTKEPWETPKKDPDAKPAKPPRPIMVSDLPKACAAVASAPSAQGSAIPVADTNTPASQSAAQSRPQTNTSGVPVPPAEVPRPSSRPSLN